MICEQNEKFNKDMEIITKKQTGIIELKNTVIEIKKFI